MTVELATAINRVARLEGSFVLRSGQRSSHYFDKYRFESDPRLLAQVARKMLDLVPTETEVFAGLELGGVPIATAMALQSGLPIVFVRKEAKTYGTCRAVEGADVQGRRTVIVEDVISTGGAVADASVLLASEGAILDTVVCAIWRGAGEPCIAGVPNLVVRPALTEADLNAATAE